MKEADTLQNPSIKNEEEKKVEYKRSLTEYIAIGTLIFLTGSFLNNFILMMTFNINVSNYYEAKDYIASSSNVLALLAVSILFGIVLVFIEEKTKKKFKIEQSKIKIFISIIKFLTMFSGAIYAIYVLTLANFSITMITIIIATFFFVFLSGYFTSYIKNEETQMIVFIACAFHLFIITITIIEIQKVLTPGRDIIYHLKENKDLNINSTKHIKTTSKYSFFYDKKNKKTIVIPNTDIVQIEQMTNELLE